MRGRKYGPHHRSSVNEMNICKNTYYISPRRHVREHAIHAPASASASSFLLCVLLIGFLASSLSRVSQAFKPTPRSPLPPSSPPSLPPSHPLPPFSTALISCFWVSVKVGNTMLNFTFKLPFRSGDFCNGIPSPLRTFTVPGVTCGSLTCNEGREGGRRGGELFKVIVRPRTHQLVSSLLPSLPPSLPTFKVRPSNV